MRLDPTSLPDRESGIISAVADRKRDFDALVALALAADLEYADRADLCDVVHVCATAGLQVDAGDFQKAYAPSAARRLHAHRLDEVGARIELGLGDPDGARLARTWHQV